MGLLAVSPHAPLRLARTRRMVACAMCHVTRLRIVPLLPSPHVGVRDRAGLLCSCGFCLCGAECPPQAYVASSTISEVRHTICAIERNGRWPPRFLSCSCGSFAAPEQQWLQAARTLGGQTGPTCVACTCAVAGKCAATRTRTILRTDLSLRALRDGVALPVPVHACPLDARLPRRQGAADEPGHAGAHLA